MKTKPLTESQVMTMLDKASCLPQTENLPEFHEQSPVVREERSRHAQRIDSFFAPVLDAVDWEGAASKRMPKEYAKQFGETARLLAACDLTNHLKLGVRKLSQEASTAGVDLPTFVRQLLLTVTRAYPQLYTLQLFGTLPLQGPVGRLVFKDTVFDSAYNGSTPTINVGDRVDDISKWNPGFFSAPEGTMANKLKDTWHKLDVSASSYRVLSEWSDDYADDVAAVYGENADASQASARAWSMSRLVDRTMLAALSAQIPSANQVTWIQQPTNNPNYAQLSPSEQLAYDGGIYRDGLLKAQHKIRITRKFNEDSEVTWGICGADFAYALSRQQGFVPFQTTAAEMELQKGPIRDLGTLKGVNIRFIVDPAFTVSGSSAVCALGHRPMERGAVGLYFMPYINMEPTRDFYDPNIGQITKGTRSRFGVAQPNTGVEPASSQLAEIYGLVILG